MLVKSFAVSAALLLACAPASAVTQASVKKAAAEAFADPIKTYDIPGLVVGVSIGGKHYVYSHGVAARDGGKPVDADTIFELGSVSKTFGATLAALAAEEGLLSLDAPTSRYLPQLKGSAFDDITVSNLATHTNGGLPLQVPDQVTDMPGLMTYLAQWKPESAVGTTRKYSNISAGLLGYVAAQGFGKDYADAVQEQILAPLKMKSTFITIPDKAKARYAYGYPRDKNQPVRVNPGVLDAEAYGVKSTLNDMMRFVDAQLGTAATPAKLDRAIAETHRGRYTAEYFTQGMIWEQYPWPVELDRLKAGNDNDVILNAKPVEKLPEPSAATADVLLNKTGSTNGFGTYVVLLPGEKAGIVVIANRNYPNTARVEATYRLLQALNLTK